jgi:hypothetical protein
MPMNGRPRWDGDTRGIGVRSAEDATGPFDGLMADMRRADWVSEEPIAHLEPKLRAWLDERGADAWELRTLSVEEDRLVIDVTWLRRGRIRDLRADAFALIGSFAEAVTAVSQRAEGATVVFEVATGQPDGQFAPHGHLVVVHVVT